MSLTAISVLINYVSRGWAAFLAIAFVPIFINLLGIEGYALVGLYISLSSLMVIVNMGLNATVMRELARYTGGALSGQEAKDLVFSAASLFTGILLVFMALAYLAIPIVFYDWAASSELEHSQVILSIKLAFVALALRAVGAMYRNGLIGLDKHIDANTIDITFITLRYIGTTLLLVFYKNGIIVFFTAQVFICLGEIISYRLFLLAKLPTTKRSARWQVQLLIRNWRYSVGVAGFGCLTTLLLQADKLILTKLVSLEQFGYYSVAFTVAAVLSALSYPVVVTWQPKLARLYAEKKFLQLDVMYKYGCRLLVLATVPASLVLCAFADELLLLWQQSEDVIQNSSLAMSLLVLAQMMLALTYMTQVLQMAYGWTRLLVTSQALALLALIPTLVIMSSYWGITGAASAVLLVLSIYSLLITYRVNRRLMSDMAVKWLTKYIAPSAMTTIIVIASVKLLFINSSITIYNSLAQVLIASTLSFIVSVVLSGQLRKYLRVLYCEHINR